MITVLGQIAATIGAIIGLLMILYQTYWSPRAKARQQAVKDGQEAADKLDASGVTAAFDRLRNKSDD